MSYTNLLINKCDVLSFTEGIADVYGHPIKTWAIKGAYAGIDCRHVVGKGREIKVGAEVVIVYDELFVEDIDITEQDRVRMPETTGDVYGILAVVSCQDGAGGHHKECFIERVK